MELLFALELLFIIRPGAPDHGAAGAPQLVLLIIRLLFIIRVLVRIWLRTGIATWSGLVSCNCRGRLSGS